MGKAKSFNMYACTHMHITTRVSYSISGKGGGGGAHVKCATKLQYTILEINSDRVIYNILKYMHSPRDRMVTQVGLCGMSRA